MGIGTLKFDVDVVGFCAYTTFMRVGTGEDVTGTETFI